MLVMRARKKHLLYELEIARVSSLIHIVLLKEPLHPALDVLDVDVRAPDIGLVPQVLIVQVIIISLPLSSTARSVLAETLPDALQE